MRVYEALCHAVAAENVEVLFGLMAEDNMNFMIELNELYGDRIKILGFRHEQNAVAAASGYYQATGEVGVCSVGRGPGIAQTGSTLVSAAKRRAKMLIILPETPISNPFDIKYFDQRTFLESTGVEVVPVRSGATLAEDTRRAFHRARSGRGPVALSIPWDLLESEIDGSNWNYQPSTVPVTGEIQRVQPDPEKIRQAAALLATSERAPVIIAGRGAAISGAKEALEALAARTGAMLATTLQGKDLFAGHPFNLGVVGSFATNLTAEFVSRADCILAVGASLNMYTTLNGQLLERARVIHIDSDPTRIEAVTPVELGIIADARQAVEAILHELEKEGVDRSSQFWTSAIREQIAATDPLFEGHVEGPPMPGTLDPREFIAELNNVLPNDRFVVLDGGHFVRWPIDGLNIGHPSNMVWTLDFASIGQGMGTAIGAAMGKPDRPTVLIAGDAGFLMAIQEVETAARYNIPLTIIVMNDQALGSEYHNLVKDGRPAGLSCIPTPDLAEVARAFGARGLTVASKDEIPLIAEHMRREGPPLVVDVKINREIRHRSK